MFSSCPSSLRGSIPALLCVLCASAIQFFAAPVHAQVAPSILIQPWPADPILAQTYDQPMFIDTGEVDQDGTDLSVFAWDSYGRVKFDREDRDPDIVVGYRFLNVSVEADRGDLDSVYNDLAIVGGFRLGEWHGWDIALLGGAGSSNDDHWRNSDANYGIGAVNFSRELRPGEQLHIGVSYDGNRSFLPDVPLPYASYVNTTDKTLVWVLGVPVSSVTWRPTEAWTVSVSYLVPVDFAASVSYRLSERWSLFAEYEKKLDAFHEHDASPDDYRLFYERSFVAGGVRYEHPWADIRVGLGYAFEQEFSRGWDSRDTVTVADVDGQPLLMFTILGTF